MNSQGDKMNPKGKTPIKESKMKVTTPKLIRWAGLSAMVAGIIFTAVQPAHPTFNTSTFMIITSLRTSMPIFALLGITGLYARQVEETGWKGLAGYLLLTIYFAVQMCISFIEPVVLPLLTTMAPAFVESVWQLSSGTGVPTNLDSLTTVYSLASILYVLGSMLFGIATFRARILPRGAAVLLVISGPLAGTMFTLLPYQLVQLTSIPIGAAMVWLGYALFSERREKASESLLDHRIVSQEPSKAA
jgi:hypothetical protein